MKFLTVLLIASACIYNCLAAPAAADDVRILRQEQDVAADHFSYT